MEPINAALLLLLSAIWGGSFMFTRYLAPILGPIAVADLRMLLAGLFLAIFFLVTGFKAGWKKSWKVFLVIGVLNSAVPFLLYSFAALTLPASMEAIFNSLSPLFGAVFSALWLGEKLTPRKSAGIVIGVAGVVLTATLGPIPLSPQAALAIIACAGAPACYGLAGVYIKKKAADAKPLAIAGGSQLLAGLLVFPAVGVFPPPGTVDLRIAAITLVFAFLCSAVAYVIYFRLIAAIGPTKALTVTFLIPVFGMLWGRLVLGERITLSMAAGAAVILAGTFFVAVQKKRRSAAPA